MKKSDYSSIKEGKYRKGFLMFIQTMEELLFYYSYESYKLPALNSHFLCLDILSTEYNIERKAIAEGNFIPLAEEFEEMVEKDIFFIEKSDYAKVLLQKRDKHGKVVDFKGLDSKAKLKRYTQIANSLSDQFSLENNSYLSYIIEKLVKNIFTEEYDLNNSRNILMLSRQLATELVNSGYSIEYIYNKVKEVYSNNDKQTVEVTEELFNDFVSNFSFETNIYKVVFGINSAAASFLKHFDKITVVKVTEETQKEFRLRHRNDYLVEVKLEELDEYSAADTATEILGTLIGIHRISQHRKPVNISKYVKVYLLEKDDEELHLFSEFRKTNVLQRVRNESKIDALSYDEQLQNIVKKPTSFIKAIILHNNAIDNNVKMNQLLDLWTAVEVLVDFKQGEEDKINVICSCMTRILCREYLYRQVEQLYKDIVAVQSEIALQIEELEGDESKIYKFAKILSVREYNDVQKEIYEKLEEYPLLQSRMDHLANNIFKNSKTVFEELERHKNKVRWQIMRIYRNRNMIVHDGEYMPYLSIILGNLHYYVDCMMNTLMEYFLLGYRDNHTVYFNIEKEEMIYYNYLGLDEKGKLSSPVEITKDNYSRVLFNYYDGEKVKKQIQEQAKKIYD